MVGSARVQVTPSGRPDTTSVEVALPAGTATDTATGAAVPQVRVMGNVVATGDGVPCTTLVTLTTPPAVVLVTR